MPKQILYFIALITTLNIFSRNNRRLGVFMEYGSIQTGETAIEDPNKAKDLQMYMLTGTVEFPNGEGDYIKHTLEANSHEEARRLTKRWLDEQEEAGRFSYARTATAILLSPNNERVEIYNIRK